MRSVHLSADELDRLVGGCARPAACSPRRRRRCSPRRRRPAEELEALAARREAGEPLEPLLGLGGVLRAPARGGARGVRAAAAHRAAGATRWWRWSGPGRWWSTSAAASARSRPRSVLAGPRRRGVRRRRRPGRGGLCPAQPAAGAGLRGRPLRRPADRRCAARCDVVAANAPYVPTEAIALMPREARDHEHRVALDGGPDGLAVQRRVIAEAPAWLRPGGHVLVETGRSQLDGTSAALRAAGFAVAVAADDESGGLVARGRRTPTDGMEGRSGHDLEFGAPRGPSVGDGSHPHVRRSPGGGWLRSGAVASSGRASASATRALDRAACPRRSRGRSRSSPGCTSTTRSTPAPLREALGPARRRGRSRCAARS